MSNSEAEETLAWHMRVNDVKFDPQYMFHPGRRWRFDFVLLPLDLLTAIEVEGGAHSGGHRRHQAADLDCEKHNAAMKDGWKVYRFTPAMVSDGRAIDVILDALDPFAGRS